MSETIEAKWKCGQVFYSPSDVERTAHGHARDGIHYYPPHSWGGKCHVPLWIAEAYERGFKTGLVEHKQITGR